MSDWLLIVRLIVRHGIFSCLYKSYMIHLLVFLVESISLLEGHVCSLLGRDLLELAISLVCFKQFTKCGPEKGQGRSTYRESLLWVVQKLKVLTEQMT